MPSGSDFKYATGDTTAWKSKYYAFVDYALSVGASVADIEAFLAENSSFSPGSAPTSLDTARDCLTAGSATAYTATFAPAFTSLANGIELKVRWHTDNGANPTLDLDGLGARAIVRPDGGVPEAGALKANYTGKVVYNATVEKWVLVSNIAQDPPAAPTVQVFTASGTWTKPAGCRAVIVEVQGAGGGGGGAGSTGPRVGGHAGGGGYSRKLIDVSAIASATVVVGSGGAGDTGTGTGGAGGNSSWADGTNTVTGNGGAGGPGGSVDYPSGGAGGSASGGDINIPGGDGGAATSKTAGGSVLAPAHARSDGSIAQRHGANYGGGGLGGGVSNGDGGDGANGLVMVTEFY